MSVPDQEGTRHITRFSRTDRLMHGFLMFSFLGLALTGLPLLFSHATWASVLARTLGGVTVAGVLHRFFAVILIGVFVTHIARLLRRVFGHNDYSIFWGPTSMVPQPRDLEELKAHILWFLGRGPRPAFERYTYWEKFDYWAVFWGMAIIGGSGLMLWFPEQFSRVVPGWMFNIALLVHGEEALLAVGFIFTLHFFNGHLRPEKFPMDMVMFTGSVTEAELQHERPAEYDRLRQSGELERLTVPPPARSIWRFGRVVGTTAITIGLALVVLILFALVTS
jgi:cytochrome b subunit of formate dehydrogenase